MNNIIKSSGGLFTQIVLFALVPAICEETLFRGFILSAFRDKKTFGQKNEKHVMFAIVGSGILFGIMHLDFIRIIPTSILGMVMAYNVYKSKSIFTSVGIHFFNNLLSVLSVNFGVQAMLLVGSGILFGIMHLDFIRIIPTSILGMVMAYNVYKSKSIFTSVGIHFFNNLLSVLSVNFGVQAMLLLITSILGMVMAYNVYKSKSIFTSVGIHFFNNLLSVLSVNFGVQAMLLLI